MIPQSTYSEDFLYWLWDNKSLIDNDVKLQDGRSCRLIYRGERNFDGGPDYKNVSLDIDSKIISGAIEIHLVASNWIQHKHHLDQKYNTVILHVVLTHDAQTQTTTREDGVKIPLLELVPNLRQPLGELYEQYNISTGKIQPDFNDCPLSLKKADDRLRWIERAGMMRLNLKVMAFKEQRAHDSWEQILYRGLMEGLGYSKNQIPFRKLANRLPVEFIFRELSMVSKRDKSSLCEGVLFGAAGLLPGKSQSTLDCIDEETQSYIQTLREIWEDYWHRIGIMPMKTDEWQFFRLRPQNFPTRRLAGMCILLVRFYNDGILKTLLRILHGLYDDPEALIREFENCLLCEATGYWERHFKFDASARKQDLQKMLNIIGPNRARDIVINSLLPVFYLYAQETEDGVLLTRMKEIYRRYPPAAENSITREMKKKMFPASASSRRLINSAQKQQGLIHLYKRFCLNDQCDNCVREQET
ncbi:DUF2851 family protein [candidate division KSB1 bacterium]|nr:DUF2851 family protein [candidate division KSB1 bacterium]